MKKTILTFALFIFSFAANAVWQIDTEQSSVTFVSTKQEHIREIHKIPGVSGSISVKGELAMALDLSSIESGIDIRNQRMKEMLFNVATFPTATITAQLPDLSRKTKLDKFDAQLNLHGLTKTIQVEALVTRTAKGEIMASLTQPIIISASDFGLEAGVAALQKVTGLTSIGTSVPVYVTLVFKKTS